MVSEFKLLHHVTPLQLSREWDDLAVERHYQIESGLDITFHHVMTPMVQGLIGSNTRGTLVDIGSGTGEMTAKISSQFNRVVCIEPSLRSIEISREVLSGFAYIEFHGCDLESCNLNLPAQSKATFLASMVLSATVDINNFVLALSRLVPKGSRFIATIPHPCFWPRYWGYDKEGWFSYKKELFVQAPFKISSSKSFHRSTHVHRPIEMYVSAFRRCGFSLDKMVEPVPDPIIQSFYPKEWEFPRFLGMRWTKIS